MSDDKALKAELEKLRAQNAALKSNKEKGLSMKIGEKGGLSVFGLGEKLNTQILLTLFS